MHTPASRRDGRTTFSAARLVLASLIVSLIPVAAAAQAPAERRSYDARETHNRGYARGPAALQQHRLGELAGAGLSISFDPTTGALHTVSNPVGFLTDGRPGADPEAEALAYVNQMLDLIGLDLADLEGMEVTDRVKSSVSGSTHLYLRQRHLGIPVMNGQLQINLDRDNRIVSVNNAFLPRLFESVNVTAPRRGAAQAVASAAAHLGVVLDRAPEVVSRSAGPQRSTRIEAAALSTAPIDARLMWLPIRHGDARLVWSFQLQTPGGEHWWDMTVDAVSGKVWTRFDWVADATYKVYPLPVESPNHTSPLPNADARVTLTNPSNSAASPNGWHSTGTTSWTVHRGNNVHAFEDRDGNNAPPASEVSCGASLACSFAINLAGAPSTYTSASITNAFYWSNLVHDIQYGYGFNEGAGNFQVNNFGKGGTGNDDVRVLVQHTGAGFCPNNAWFATPPEGQRPTMRLCEFTAPNPDRDSALDAGIIVHEYGHGISNRQVGGPSNTSCLQNAQQMGEGWSDWLALVYTAKAGDVGTTGRGLGTYVLGQPTTGVGIRTQRYSTDPAVNNWTFASIGTFGGASHGIGSVWAQALWEVYWSLVGQYGFSSNLYGSGAGNQRALRYVNEGMKFTGCSPSFLTARDGVIQAATVNFSGQDVCRIWTAFAAFGLGSNATTPGSGSTTGTNGFAVPTSCQPPAFTVSITGPTVLQEGQSGTWTATPSNAPGAVTYKWLQRLEGSSTWTQIGTAQSVTRTGFVSFDLKVEATSVGQTVSKTIFVYVAGECQPFIICP